MDKKLVGKFRQLKRLEQSLFRRHSAKHLDVNLMIWTFLNVHNLIFLSNGGNPKNNQNNPFMQGFM